MDALEWTRPAGLAALVLPLVVLLLSLRRERPRPVASGAFALWRRLASAAAGSRRRRRLPLERALLIAALVAGALALAGPRRRSAVAPPRWTVVVDRSPSLYLASGRAGTTRLESALVRLEGERAARRPPPELVWVEAPGGETGHGAPELPPAWRDAPRPARSDPIWERFDRPGFVWLTDRVPDATRRAAGVCASGGAAVPGPIGGAGRTRLDWDGVRVVEVPDGLPERVLRLDSALPEPLAAFGRLWAGERGFALDEGTQGPAPALELAVAAAGAPAAAVLEGDGWRLRGRAGRLDAVGELAPWPVDRAPALVAHGPGRVATAFVDAQEPEGDPAAFALEWAALLDGACLPPPGAVALDERVDAGEAHFAAPAPAPAPRGAERVPLDAAAAALATLLALASSLAARLAAAPGGARATRYDGAASAGRTPP